MRERTGLTIDPYFSGTKIEWLLRNVEGAERAVFGTIDSWLLFKLTGRHLTDYTNASRTMLFDIRKLAWDAEICDLLGVDPARLPQPLPSSGVFGTTTEFGGEVPVAGVAGDQQAALFGQACHHPGMAKNTYGTGSFVLLNSGPEPPGSPTACWRRSPGGSARRTSPTRWRPRSSSPAPRCSGCATGSGSSTRRGRARRSPPRWTTNDGVYFVPALTGLGSPHWDPYARGTIVGLTRGSGRAHLARAALEAIAYETVDAVRAQEAACGERLELLRADGGAVANRWLMQFQADVLGVPVSVPEISETTALGAAYLAGIATGAWTLEQVGEMWREADRYEPRMESAQRRAAAGRLATQPWRGRARMGEMKPQVYKDPRPAEYFDQFHAAARKGVGWTYTLRPHHPHPADLLLWRVRAIGVENVPKDGPLVLAPNHFSQMDHFFVGLYLRRKIRFMAKSQLFGTPVLTYIYKHGGVFPIRRGHHDEEAFETVRQLLAQGEMLLVYAEGGRSRSQQLGEPKPGIGRIALESGVPIVPVAIHGSEYARQWKRFRFPKITVQFGEPLIFPVEASPPRAPTGDRKPRSSPRCGRCTKGWLLVARVEPGVEVRVVTGRDHHVGELGAEEAQLLQGAAEVVGVGGARRRGSEPSSCPACTSRRRRSRSHARRGGRSPTCGRHCGPGCRRDGSSRRRRGRRCGRSWRRSRSMPRLKSTVRYSKA